MKASSEPVSTDPGTRRVAVVTSDVPFVEGGHRTIAESLVGELEKAGHRAEAIKTPQNRFGRQFSAYLANWLTDVGESGDGEPVDQVISLRYPSYAVRHPRHVCWLNHRMREYYDLWPRFSGRLSRKGKVKETVRRTLIRTLDAYLLKRNVTRLFAQSKIIQSRLVKWGNIDSEVLHPPPPPRAYRTEAYEPYIFAVSRLHPLKRIDLLIQALAQVENLGAKIAGTGEEEKVLRRMASELGISHRIEFLGRVDEENLLLHYARCRAVYFAPFMEDYGFVTLEAFRSKKPLLTCKDSGGPTELVAHDRSGYVVEPEAGAVARHLDRWGGSQEKAVSMGETAFDESRGITWETTIPKLLLP
jgi:glycosyltransferase involved in cell wall biosynthesis